MEIIWTRLAKITYFEIFENLKERWTIKEMKSFYDLTNEVLHKIQSNHILFPLVNKELEIRKVVIHQNVSLYFKIEHEKIYLISFFNNRMNPQTLNILLKKSQNEI